MNPNIQWLIDKWQLPKIAIPPLEALISSEANGSTAVALSTASAEAIQPTLVQQPFVPVCVVTVDNHAFLQSRANRQKEISIREHLLAAANCHPSPLPPHFDDWCSKLFPDANPHDPQLSALKKAWERPICCITGGPGTGKTYTLARILAFFASMDYPSSAIFLCAPTGKAAQRMRESMTACLKAIRLSLSDEVISKLQEVANNACTLHHLLGYHPDKMQCTRQCLPDNTILVVDECSMLDLNMWDVLLKKLPAKDFRLLLLGDPEQLESIGMGDVLNRFYCAAQDAGNPFGSSLRKIHVNLLHSHRFANRPALAELALTLRNGDSQKVLALLSQQTQPDAPGGVYWHPLNAAIPFKPEVLTPMVHNRLRQIATADSPLLAIEAIQRACILAAHNNDWIGTRALNRQLDTAIQLLGDTRNQPIIINQNDPETGLRNGTIGVIHKTATHQRLAWFQNAAGDLQSFPVSRLPEHSPAWAITIHRAQGSEYDDVTLLLPFADSPLATRALLYTAITRARNNVYIYGTSEAIAKAVATKSNRLSLIF
jgi:exodeoxyribonuclease V alpha subunit